MWNFLVVFNASCMQFAEIKRMLKLNALIMPILPFQWKMAQGSTAVWCMSEWRSLEVTSNVLHQPKQRYGEEKQMMMLVLTTYHCHYNYHTETRSSAIVEGPRDASCQLKSCQLPRNSAVRQVLNKSKLWSWRFKVGQGVVNISTQPWRVRVAFIVLYVS